MFVLWPKENSYKEFDNEKKFLRLENYPPPTPHNFSDGPSLTKRFTAFIRERYKSLRYATLPDVLFFNKRLLCAFACGRVDDKNDVKKIACSKRSDSGERCEVKKASRSFLLPTAPPLSERLEQARKKRQIIIISNKQNKQWKYWWKYCGTCYVKEIWLTSLLTDG